ncbi:nicotinate-nucleotide--dimethylbenzimidazole phosphoribosyltransferase [Desulfovibrio sp. OttesenSCG-928-F07]|nr:nicotinate-nucleotide--dimethylbenzimidazole phosphoribosyltransferase [Desulfovibrio sp. OttesenSCG-928-F07]
MLSAFKALSDTELHSLFQNKIREIPAVDKKLTATAQAHLDNLTKPLGSLGRLETLATRLFCIGAGKQPLAVDKAMLFTIAADHGVVEEGVSHATQEVTGQMLQNFLNGGAGINVICKSAGWDFLAVDAGVAGPPLPDAPKLINAKIMPGTANIAKGPAMNQKEVLTALLLGINLADIAQERGYKCLGTGEMGIGNTTPSSALFCAWLGLTPVESVGPGAGLVQDLLTHKAAVVKKALTVNSKAIESNNPLQVLAALGGIEIAVMAGIMLGAAKNRLPVLVDGFIATAAYLAAFKLNPLVSDYAIFAHCSAESAHQNVLNRIGRKPLLDMRMRLGEGTGAALALPILRAAADIYNNMASFKSAGVTVQK